MEIRIIPLRDISEVLPQSKAIKKPKKARKANSNDLNKDDVKQEFIEYGRKKYRTVDSSLKNEIVLCIKKGLLLMIDLDKEIKPVSADRFLQIIEEVDFQEFTQLVLRVLAKHMGIIVTLPKKQAQWRRKIKNWITTSGKPEKRGGEVIPEQHFENFKERLSQLLRKMPVRTYPILKEKILKMLEEYHNADPANEGKPFNRKTCSKHWWFDFMKKNEDIKHLWQRLPMRRGVSHTKLNPSLFSRLDEEGSDVYDSNEEMEEEEDEEDEMMKEEIVKKEEVFLKSFRTNNVKLEYSNQSYETTFDSHEFFSPVIKADDMFFEDEEQFDHQDLLCKSEEPLFKKEEQFFQLGALYQKEELNCFGGQIFVKKEEF